MYQTEQHAYRALLDQLRLGTNLLQGDSDLAARTMLLAVAWLTHDDDTFGKATAVSDVLLAAMREALDAFHNPPPLAA